jgi:hypothetical protein
MVIIVIIYITTEIYSTKGFSQAIPNLQSCRMPPLKEFVIMTSSQFISLHTVCDEIWVIILK